jgi:uncharacterized protein (TIGR00255 family)
MIKSMTGFASLTHEDEAAVIGVTIRAVNHRYLDVQLRMPTSLSDREAAVRAAIQRHVARGRIEVSLSLQLRTAPVPVVELNAPFVMALQGALEQARQAGLLEGALAPGDLLRLPAALTIREQTAGGESLPAGVHEAVTTTVERALADLDRMRTHEGAQLRADFAARRATLAALIEQLAAAADAGRQGLEARLHERVRELAADIQLDRTLLAQEIVRAAARSDISEEVTRFRAHLVHWDTLSDGPEPCGRKLDFLLQEMNREINTIGSKADGLGVSELIVAAKAELEKLREQVQNVE